MSLLSIRGNTLGLAMIVATGAIAGLGGLVLKLPDALVMSAVGGALIVMGVIIRWRARPAPGWLTQSQFGGYLFFVPAWGTGLVIMVANVISVVMG
jgi:hypothetical protein